MSIGNLASNVGAGALVLGAVGGGGFGGYQLHQHFTNDGASDSAGRIGGSVALAGAAAPGALVGIAVADSLALQDLQGSNWKLGLAAAGVAVLGLATTGMSGGLLAGAATNGVRDAAGAIRD